MLSLSQGSLPQPLRRKGRGGLLSFPFSGTWRTAGPGFRGFCSPVRRGRGVDSCLLVCVSAGVSGRRMWTVDCASPVLCALHECMCVRVLGWAWWGGGSGCGRMCF